MNQNHVPTCVQLDDVVDPEIYLELALNGFSIPTTAPSLTVHPGPVRSKPIPPGTP